MKALNLYNATGADFESRYYAELDGYRKEHENLDRLGIKCDTTEDFIKNLDAIEKARKGKKREARTAKERLQQQVNDKQSQELQIAAIKQTRTLFDGVKANEAKKGKEIGRSEADTEDAIADKL